MTRLTTRFWSYPLNFNPQGRMDNSAKLGSSRLLVRNAGDKDVGTFTCHLNKEGTPEHQSRDIRVIVAPMLKIHQEMQDKNLVLQCLIQAFPSPNIYWKIDFDEKPADLDVPEFSPDSGYKVDKDTELVVNHSMERYVLSDFDQVSNATLTVIGATSSDFGRYRCVAENEAGRAIATSTYGPDLTIVYIIVPIIVVMITISVRMELLYLVLKARRYSL
ncbi:hypothetical protein B566_EDAN012101 [Ephemera danica]|nr:hypothetical protein B566_EDAN012101 [Ephemera danica]